MQQRRGANRSYNMAEKSLVRDSLMCPICLGLLQCPVTIPCGHSYCSTCIDYNWKNSTGRYSCPECRKSFHSRPALVKNIMLARLVEQVTGTEAPAADLFAGPQDVSCDMCTGKRKMKAHKSCLQCLVSYCEMHLKPHYHITVLQKHQLVAPSHTLQKNICPEHNKVKKHVTVRASAEKKLSLQDRKGQVNQNVQQIEKELQNLKKKEKKIKSSAERAVERVEGSTQEVVSCLQEKERKLKSQILVQRDKELDLVKVQKEEHLRNICTLKKSISDMDALMRTRNPCRFLQQYPSLSCPPLHPPAQPMPRTSHSPTVYAETVGKAVSQFNFSMTTSITEFSAPEPEAS